MRQEAAHAPPQPARPDRSPLPPRAAPPRLKRPARLSTGLPPDRVRRCNSPTPTVSTHYGKVWGRSSPPTASSPMPSPCQPDRPADQTGSPATHGGGRPLPKATPHDPKPPRPRWATLPCWCLFLAGTDQQGKGAGLCQGAPQVRPLIPPAGITHGCSAEARTGSVYSTCRATGAGVDMGATWAALPQITQREWSMS